MWLSASPTLDPQRFATRSPAKERPTLLPMPYATCRKVAANRARSARWHRFGTPLGVGGRCGYMKTHAQRARCESHLAAGRALLSVCRRFPRFSWSDGRQCDWIWCERRLAWRQGVMRSTTIAIVIIPLGGGRDPQPLGNETQGNALCSIALQTHHCCCKHLPSSGRVPLAQRPAILVVTTCTLSRSFRTAQRSSYRWAWSSKVRSPQSSSLPTSRRPRRWQAPLSHSSSCFNASPRRSFQRGHQSSCSGSTAAWRPP